MPRESGLNVTTNYDPIAEQYKRSKQQSWRSYIEAFGLLQRIGRLKSSADCNGPDTPSRAMCACRQPRRQPRNRGPRGSLIHQIVPDILAVTLRSRFVIFIEMCGHAWE